MLRSKPQVTPTDERRINELIERGGTIATESDDNQRTMLVQLRLSSELVQRIDRHRKERIVPPSRHSWMLEALLDKLQAKQ